MFVILMAIWGSVAVSAAPPTQSSTLDQSFTKIFQAAADADARGDNSTYERRTAPNYFVVDERGGVTTRRDALAMRPSAEARQQLQREYQEVKLSERVVDVHAELYGDTAIVRSRLVMGLILNGEPVSKEFRVTHVFVRKGGGWLVASKQETVIPLDPTPVRNNHKLYDDYVGHFRLTSSRIYTVTRDGDRLFWGNKVKHELVPESDTLFVIKGDQYRVDFIRDSSGAVSRIRLREFPGVEYTALRILSP